MKKGKEKLVAWGKNPKFPTFLRGKQEKENSAFLTAKGKSLGKEEQRSFFCDKRYAQPNDLPNKNLDISSQNMIYLKISKIIKLNFNLNLIK